jgi:hypothetical protein
MGYIEARQRIVFMKDVDRRKELYFVQAVSFA